MLLISPNHDSWLTEINLIIFQDKDGYALWIMGNMISGGLAGASSLVFVYSLDYARTRLANDAKSAKKGGERQFNGLLDVYVKTLKSVSIVLFFPLVFKLCFLRSQYCIFHKKFLPLFLLWLFFLFPSFSLSLSLFRTPFHLIGWHCWSVSWLRGVLCWYRCVPWMLLWLL